MQTQFTTEDRRIMQIALEEAKIAAEDGNYPVGAVLAINGEVIGKTHNHKEVKIDSVSHAEALLFLEHSGTLRKYKHEKAAKTLYTTLEPCLMCFGMAVIHRVERIVVGCSDPRGNMSSIRPEPIGDWYVRNWPKLEYGLMIEPSHALLFEFFSKRTDPEALEAKNLLEDLKNTF